MVDKNSESLRLKSRRITLDTSSRSIAVNTNKPRRQSITAKIALETKSPGLLLQGQEFTPVEFSALVNEFATGDDIDP